MCSWLLVVFFLGFLALGEGYPNEDLVVRLPGQPEVDFRQFAGYVNVDEEGGRSLFYYFAEAEGDAVHKRPLALWLNGGPGCSSIGGGAFTELGPFFPRGDGRGLRRNRDSWNKVANLLFVESPAGVGWSYSNRSSDYIGGDHATVEESSYAVAPYPTSTKVSLYIFPRKRIKVKKINTTDDTIDMFTMTVHGSSKFTFWTYSVSTTGSSPKEGLVAMMLGKASQVIQFKEANDMRTFLLKWFEKFPEFKARNLFLTGESYAGHYIPQLADALLDYNKHSSNFKFRIKGIAIGNPLLKLDRDAAATYEYFWSHGMISDELGLTITSKCDFEDYTFSSPHNVSQSCNNAIAEANRIVGDYINNYDVILDVCYPSIVQQELRLRQYATKISVGVDVCMTFERRFYFNLPEVQRALHANRTNLPYRWSMCSDVLKYNYTDGNINILPILGRIIRNKIPILIFSGDQDSVVPLLGSRTLVRELAHDYKFNITVPYTAWFHKGQVAGWATEYGKLLTFATVRGAAHMVPYAQPGRALLLFSSFINGQKLPSTTKPPID